MHPELIAALAKERRRDLDARTGTDPEAAARRRGRASRALLPRYRLTWTRTTLAAAAGGRPSRSLIIVISASRAR